jgi:hypothetical protein
MAVSLETLTPDGRTLSLGRTPVKFDGVQLGILRDSAAQPDNMNDLRLRMKEDGYLLLRGLVNRAAVQAACEVVRRHLDKLGQLENDATGTGYAIKSGAAGAYLGGQKSITHSAPFLRVAEGPELFQFFNAFLGEPALTYNYKWLRAVANGEPTPAHYDVVFMGRGTVENLFTCWLPLSDVAIDGGPLALLSGSHALPAYKKVRDTYGRADVDRDRIDSNFSHDPMEIVARFGGQWQTAEYRAGDVLIFGMHTMHAALKNQTSRMRISADIRFQPRSAPTDERWVGSDPIGNHVWSTIRDQRVPIEESRKQWGV